METKIRYYFNDEPDDVIKKIQFDDVSLYSITRQDIANKMTTILTKLRYITTKSLILDATACIGGNSYSFAKTFDKVIAVEIDERRCEMLKHNLGLFQVGHKVSVQHDDCIKFISNSDTFYDIIFFDPPWGGTEYINKSVINLYLNDKPILGWLPELEKKAKYVCIKVPLNFDFALLKNIKYKYKVYDDFYRMRLIIISMFE
jgi:16S rRNA G966 N2-methylase RsmD